MSQWIKWGTLSGGGIIVVLFIMGFILYITDIMRNIGEIAIMAAIGIGIIFALLGVVGILKRLT